MISNTEERRDIRFKYHSPVPNSYRIPNPSKPLRTISDEVFEEFKKMAFEIGVAGLSYSKLSDDFKAEWNIDFDNVIILKYEMSPDFLYLEPSKEKCKLIDDEFQEVGGFIYDIADFLRENGFEANLLNPLDDEVSLRAIATQSNDCVILRSNMCLFKEGLNMGFFMLSTSIDNLPFKEENDMLWAAKYCETCGKCINKCPLNAYDENEKVLRKVCTAHSEGCNDCILNCPFFKKGYDFLEKKFKKKLVG